MKSSFMNFFLCYIALRFFCLSLFFFFELLCFYILFVIFCYLHVFLQICQSSENAWNPGFLVIGEPSFSPSFLPYRKIQVSSGYLSIRSDNGFYIRWLLISLCAVRTYGVKQAFRFVEGIGLQQKRRQIRFSFGNYLIYNIRAQNV